MTERIRPRMDEVELEGVKCWLVTNDQPFVVDLEVRVASGTRVISRMPIGSNVLLIPAKEEDANIIPWRATGQPITLSLV